MLLVVVNMVILVVNLLQHNRYNVVQIGIQLLMVVIKPISFT